MKIPTWLWKKLLAILADVLYDWTGAEERSQRRQRKHDLELRDKLDKKEQ